MPGGEEKTLHLGDTYDFIPGRLIVRKIIGGPAAGRQGQIVIPAGTSGPVESHIFANIPTPATCVVTETVDGQTSTISV